MGIIYPNVKGARVVALSLTVGSMSNVAVPFVSDFNLLMLSFFVTGTALGIFETFAYCQLLEMWRSRSSSLMLILLFTYELGAVLAHLLSNSGVDFEIMTVSKHLAMPLTSVSRPYIVLSIFLLINSSTMLAVPILVPHAQLIRSDECSQSITCSNRSYPRVFHASTIGVGLMIAYTYFGLEIVYTSSITDYAKDLSFDEQDDRLLISVFWLLFSSTKLLYAFILIPRFGNRNALLLSSVICLISNAFLLVSHDNKVYMWTSVALFGIGMSSIWGTFFGFLNDITPLSSITVSLMISATVGAVLFMPHAVSSIIQDDMRLFPPMIALSSVSLTAFLSITVYLEKVKQLSP